MDYDTYPYLMWRVYDNDRYIRSVAGVFGASDDNYATAVACVDYLNSVNTHYYYIITDTEENQLYPVLEGDIIV